MKLKKCSYCKKPIEDFASKNKDADGNEYCMDCVSKLGCLMEYLMGYGGLR